MSTMVRKQIYINPEQEAKLKEIAAKLKMSESELIREGINRALLQPSAIYQDKEAWSKIKSFIQRLSKKTHVKGHRKWRREDLYDRFER